jgi:hypothetical protein
VRQGLEVLVDGIPREPTSPLRLEELERGPHVIVVRHPEWKTWRKNIVLEAGQTLELDVDLVRDPDAPPALPLEAPEHGATTTE